MAEMVEIDPVEGDAESVPALRRFGRAILEQAGHLLAQSLGAPQAVRVEAKAAFDFVTNVDRASERLLVNAIRNRYPDHAIVAEESHPNQVGQEVTWIIDPLDGTTNFIHSFPFFAISMAVAIQGKLVLGWVLDPVRKEWFEATAGEGAVLNGEPIRVRDHALPEDALVATGFPFRDQTLLDPYLAVFATIFKQVAGIRRAGAAALDLAYLAAGRVDGFWEIGLKPWDVAAGILLVEEAGGRVSDFCGGQDALTSGTIVAGTRCLYPILQQAVSERLLPFLPIG